MLSINPSLNKDNNLIEAARLGDQNALSDLIAIYEPEIKKITSKYFLPRTDYEDLIQEGRIAVFKALQSYDMFSNIPFLHFVRMVIKRKVIDSLRFYTRQKHLNFNDSLSLHHHVEGMDESFVDFILDEESNPEKKIIESESMRLLMKDLKEKFSSLESQVFQLYFIKGYKQREIVQLLEVSPKTLDNAIQRVRRKSIKYYLKKIA